MEAMSEQQQTAATPTAGNPLSPPLPLAGERSLTESGVAQRSANVAARAEESLLGAKPTPEKPTPESAARAIDRLDVPGLREALSFTGAGNHPAVVKAFVRLGQMIQEDRFRPGRDLAPATPRSPAEVIYDGGPKGSTDGL